MQGVKEDEGDVQGVMVDEEGARVDKEGIRKDVVMGEGGEVGLGGEEEQVCPICLGFQ